MFLFVIFSYVFPSSLAVSRNCFAGSTAECSSGDDCHYPSKCDGIRRQCPKPLQVPDQDTCLLTKGVCYKGKCIYSICNIHGLINCNCKRTQQQCFHCCWSDGRCIPSKAFGIFDKHGKPYYKKNQVVCGNGEGKCSDGLCVFESAKNSLTSRKNIGLESRKTNMTDNSESNDQSDKDISDNKNANSNDDINKNASDSTNNQLRVVSSTDTNEDLGEVSEDYVTPSKDDQVESGGRKASPNEDDQVTTSEANKVTPSEDDDDASSEDDEDEPSEDDDTTGNKTTPLYNEKELEELNESIAYVKDMSIATITITAITLVILLTIVVALCTLGWWLAYGPSETTLYDKSMDSTN